ncbi:unnamed protein product [Prorocentrum cordatum]|uniref:LITAF domain-containing protein n=1 Tax=Prorocentrum cordatum TaxID=2364126 RepID=A0ABN9XIW0_9DINO|nr:unnamed protein product [Polarella glacialis]
MQYASTEHARGAAAQNLAIEGNQPQAVQAVVVQAQPASSAQVMGIPQAGLTQAAPAQVVPAPGQAVMYAAPKLVIEHGFGDNPQPHQCQWCNVSMVTRVEKQPSCGTHLAALGVVVDLFCRWYLWMLFDSLLR